MLQIFSTRESAEGPSPLQHGGLVRRPGLSQLRPPLHARAISRREVVYFTVSAAPHTLQALEAVGYRRYAEGQIIFAPLLARGEADARVVEFATARPEADLLSASDRRLLADHAALGCVALIGLADGAARPLVFQRRRSGARLIPCVHVIYCREMNDLAVFSARSAAISPSAAASSASPTRTARSPASRDGFSANASRAISRGRGAAALRSRLHRIGHSRAIGGAPPLDGLAPPNLLALGVSRESDMMDEAARHKAKMAKRKAVQDAEVAAQADRRQGPADRPHRRRARASRPPPSAWRCARSAAAGGRRRAVHQGRLGDRRARGVRALRRPDRLAHDGRRLHLGDAGPRARRRRRARRPGTKRCG